MKPLLLKSVREAEAIASYRDAESWQLHEIQAGVAEFTRGRSVPHACAAPQRPGRRDESVAQSPHLGSARSS
jgi:hypothetical protein